MKNFLQLFLIICSISTTYAQNIGINTPMPTHTLDVNGSLRVRGGAPGANKILTSDANGVGSWANILPIDYSQANSGTILNITNTNTNSYHTFIARNNTDVVGAAVYGIATFTGPNTYSIGVKGENLSTSFGGAGVQGFHNGSGNGVQGYSANGAGGYFGSNNGYALITAGGNVGIGTSTPAAKMDIQGTDYLSHFYYGTNEDTYIRGGKTGSHVIINDYADQGNVGIGLSNPGYILDVNRRIRIRHTVDGTPDDNTAGIWYNNSANVEGAFSGMKTDTEVGLYLGNSWRFWVNSAGQGYLNGALIQTSDKRLKKDFTILNNSLSDIYKINGYHFRWIEEARNKELQTGFIAQEVQKIFPELVQTDEKGFLSVNYIGLIPHLLEAVKELKNENELLKTNNKSVLSRLEKIEKLLDFSAKK